MKANDPTPETLLDRAIRQQKEVNEAWAIYWRAKLENDAAFARLATAAGAFAATERQFAELDVTPPDLLSAEAKMAVRICDPEAADRETFPDVSRPGTN
jgi:hypothetical protein